MNSSKSLTATCCVSQLCTHYALDTVLSIAQYTLQLVFGTNTLTSVTLKRAVIVC